MQIARYLILAGLVGLAGCAGSPGALRDSDLDWGGVTVQRRYEDVSRDILAGLAQCNKSVAASAKQDAADQRVTIGLFIAGPAGGQSGLAIGKVLIYRVGQDATTVSAGVINPIDQPVFGTPAALRDGIVQYARGEIACQ